MIEEYHFGSISVNKKIYTYDVEIHWLPLEVKQLEGKSGKAKPLMERTGAAREESRPFRREVLPWQRKESHIIDVEDIKRAIEQNPEIVIIGTGESGIARVTEEAQKQIKFQGIKLITDITEQAIKIFNVLTKKTEKQGKQKRIIGLFHLTC